MKKIISIIGCILLSAAVMPGLAACRRGDDVDETKTQLYVGYFDGGAGTAWLDEAKAAFEDAYKEQSFEEGKTGVEIIIDKGKDDYTDAKLLDGAQYARQDVFFTHAITLKNYIDNGVFADITDIVTEKTETVGSAQVSIEDKMDDSLKSYFKTSAGKYFAIPYQVATYGIVYDKDLFQTKGLYNTEWSASGLPATFEQFKELMEIMVSRNVIPFTWSGGNSNYPIGALNAIWANYEGYNNFNLNFTFNGTWNKQDGTTQVIDNSNGYLLQGQQGKKAALTFAEHVMSNPDYYSDNAILPSTSHTDAQLEYIASTKRNNPIAMLFEGGWWENEATPVFEEMAQTGSQYSKKNRNFGFLPIPAFIGTDGVLNQVNTAPCLYTSQGATSVAVNKKTQKLELAKLFVKFTASNEALAKFTASTGIPRPYDYSLSSEQRDSMTSFQRDVWDSFHNENTSVGTMVSKSVLRDASPGYFSYWMFGSWDTGAAGARSDNPFITFYNNSSNPAKGAQWYFEGLSRGNHSQAKWQEQFALYI